MMSRVNALTHSLVGKKILMAVSGVLLIGFLVGHVYGNLKVFQGPDHFNAYAEGLRTLGAPLFGRSHLLWIARAILLVALAVHLWTAYAVTQASRRARSVRYRTLDLIATTYAARTMRWGGVVILLFVVYHLLDFTFGRVNPGFVPGDVYRNVVASFSVPVVAYFYMAALLALGLHLYHGLWSACQTLGINHPRYNHLRRAAAGTLTVLIVAGFIAIPVAVQAGVLR
jgi:succinate dehydrogenase / fumarate reductase cytochrome b subunit